MSATLRYLAAVIVAVLSGILVLGAAVAQWASSTVVSTSGFTAAVGPLSDHPAVEDALTGTVTERVITRLTETASGTPLVGPLLASLIPNLQGPVESAVGSVVRSDAAGQAWTTALTTVHDQTVAAIRGEASGVTVGSEAITIDLNTIRDPIVAQLSVPDQIRPLLQGVDLGTVDVTSGTSTQALSLAVRLADSWQWLLAAGVLAALAAGLLAPRTGAGLLVAGAATVAAAAVGSSIAASGFGQPGSPDPLSRAIQGAITEGIEPPLLHNLSLVTTSGVALLAVGAITLAASIVMRRR